MFKSVRLTSKVSLLEKYSLAGRIDSTSKSAAVQGELTELKATAHCIVKRLKERDLTALSRAIEDKGGTETKCVLFGSNERVGKRVVSEPQVTLYRVFRQPSVKSAAQLRRRLCCSHILGTDDKICINPYHYSAILEPDFSRPAMHVLTNALENEGCDSSGFYSNCTDTTACEMGTYSSAKPAASMATEYLYGCKRPRPWCYVAYWELNERIGALYEGFDETINVYDRQSVPCCEGFRLADLDRKADVADVIKRVRNHIGLGLQVTREVDGIWLYNRSEYSLFANGPTLSLTHDSSASSRHNIRVHKIPPGYSLKVYNYSQAPIVHRNHEISRGLSPPQTVRVSFAKGWGTTDSNSYCRPFVTSCPCWIEIHFFVFR